MGISICPTIDAESTEDYKKQIERVAPFVTRLHIDVADGSMTPNTLGAPADIWWPGGVQADIHVMYKQPLEHLPALIALGPQLVIVHAEAEGDFLGFAELLHRHGIETGVALLPQTPVSAIEPALALIDHVLIFSGSLGSFGGTVDWSLLDKVTQLKQLKPQLEIGWDGGINDSNAAQLVAGGVEVLNVGGFIQRSDDPHAAYATLKSALRPTAAVQPSIARGTNVNPIRRKHAAHLHHRRTRT